MFIEESLQLYHHASCGDCRFEDRGKALSNRRMEIIGASVANGFGDLGQSLGCDPAFRVGQ